MALYRCSSGNGGSAGNVVFGTGESLTASKRIECGFEPTTITLIFHLPNFSSSHEYVTTYSKNTISSKQSYLGSNGTSVGANAVPTPGLGITSVDNTGFTVNYYSAVGTGQTFDYIATSEL